jgi:hypothetical protein
MTTQGASLVMDIDIDSLIPGIWQLLTCVLCAFAASE